MTSETYSKRRCRFPNRTEIPVRVYTRPLPELFCPAAHYNIYRFNEKRPELQDSPMLLS